MLSLTAGVPITRFSIDALPERNCLARWREIRDRQIVGLDIELLNKNRYRSHGLGMVLPGLGIVAGSITSLKTIRRTKQLLVDGNDDLRLIILRNQQHQPSPHGSGGRSASTPGARSYFQTRSKTQSLSHLRGDYLCPICDSKPYSYSPEQLSYFDGREPWAGRPNAGDTDFTDVAP